MDTHILFKFARYGIESGFHSEVAQRPEVTVEIEKPGASFVTLHLHEKLRGCVGSLVAHRPLWEDLEKNGYSAAFGDYRFAPLTLLEYQSVSIEISILTNPEPIHFTSKEELQSIIRPGIDGIILSSMGKRATFLPQVWEQLPDFDQFFSHLSQKAGLGSILDYEECRIERYQVTLYHE